MDKHKTLKIAILEATNWDYSWDHEVITQITDWTEVTDDEYLGLRKYVENHNKGLYKNKTLSLLVLLDLNDKFIKKTLQDYLDEVEKEKLKKQKRQERAKEVKQTKEDKQRLKELAELARLKEKYSGQEDLGFNIYENI